MAEKHSKDGVFSPHDVIRIRRNAHKIPTRVFAEEFGVTLQCIADLITGRTHEDMNAIAPPTKPYRKHKTTQSRHRQIKKLYAQGISQTDISRKLKISLSLVCRVVNSSEK